MRRCTAVRRPLNELSSPQNFEFSKTVPALPSSGLILNPPSPIGPRVVTPGPGSPGPPALLQNPKILLHAGGDWFRFMLDACAKANTTPRQAYADSPGFTHLTLL